MKITKKIFFLTLILVFSFAFTIPAMCKKQGKKTEVYGKVVEINSDDNYINIESSGETIAILIDSSTRITYQNRNISLEDINEGDVLKVNGFYMDASVTADRIEIISKEEATQNHDAVIYSITHNASSPLRPGDTLIVTMTGSRGGKAYFDITNLVLGVYMKEISSGKYEGKYTALSGDSISNTPIIGHLTMPDGSQASAKTNSNVSIGSSTYSLQISQLLPEENSTTDNNKPNIMIIIDNNTSKGIRPQTATLKVNGNNVTSKASISNTVISYMPSSPLPSGMNTVTFSAIDHNENKVSKEWTFYVKTSQQNTTMIYSVSHNAQNTLTPGDKLIVTMVGIEGGYGVFDIGTFKTGIHMKENQNNPGTYTGEYTVANGDTAENCYITCYLKSSGQKANMTASGPVSFGSSSVTLYSPVITSPKSGDTVDVPFNVWGKTRPGYSVEITISYNLTLFGVIGIGGDSHTQQVTADSYGKFETTMSSIVSKSGTVYTIRAVSINPNGDRSPETVITVTQR